MQKISTIISLEEEDEEEEEQKADNIYEFSVQALTISQFSQYEHSVWMRFIKLCQPHIKEAITQQTQTGHLLWTPDERSEGKRHVKVRLHDLEANRGHYSRLRAALAKMGDKPVNIIYKNKSGAFAYCCFKHFFTIHFSYERNIPYVTFDFAIDLLTYYLSNSLGYHKLDLNMYFSFRHQCTRQMYRLYYGYFALGYTHISPQAIGGLLSCESEKSSYNEVDKDLLRPAHEEMEQRYQAGTCDIHFTYFPTYPEGVERHGKWPYKVVFTFLNRSDENPTGERLKTLKVYQEKIKVFLKLIWGVEEETAERLCRRIRLDMLQELDEFFRHKKWWADKMEQSKTPLRNKAGYIVAKLNEYLTGKEAR